MASNNQAEIQIAIVGGGIAGIGLAIGLLARGIKPVVYERSPSIREIGASIGLSQNAEWAMEVLDPKLLRFFKSIMTVSTSASMSWIDGQTDEYVYTRPLEDKKFETAHRVELLNGMMKLLPPGVMQFNKNLESISDNPSHPKVTLHFSDSTTATADAVLGCDGVRSQVRKFLFGTNHPSSYPSYSGKYAFRALLPLDQVQKILGPRKSTNRIMHLGPGSHIFSCNISDQFFNVTAYRSDPNPWPEKDRNRVTSTTTKEDAMHGFGSFPTVKKIIELLPEKLERWGIFDTFDHPPSTYAKGRVCLVGDAAHAMGPHVGTGAGFALEDAAAVVHLLDKVNEIQGGGTYGKGDLAVCVRAALQAYSETRMPRTKWAVANARFAGRMFAWEDPEIGCDYERMQKELEWRLNAIGNYDVVAMLAEAEQHFSGKLKSILPVPKL